MEFVWLKLILILKIIWLLVVIVGVVFFGILVFSCGEYVNVIWFVFVVGCIYSIVYCFYSLFIVNKVFEFDERCLIFVYCLNDGLDYVLINKSVLFGYYFVVIVGVGLLVGFILVV